MNISKILFHDIQWFLRDKNINKLDEYWDFSIRKFINEGYREGEFEVSIKGKTDFLIWKILKS